MRCPLAYSAGDCDHTGATATWHSQHIIGDTRSTRPVLCARSAQSCAHALPMYLSSAQSILLSLNEPVPTAAARSTQVWHQRTTTSGRHAAAGQTCALWPLPIGS